MHWGELSAEKKWKMADNLWKEIQLEIKGAIPFGLTNWQKLKKVSYSLLERVWRKDTIIYSWLEFKLTHFWKQCGNIC